MKISLRNLENSRLTLSEKDMEHLRGGGGGVRCGCLYANSGGSSSADNKAANEAVGLWTVPPDGSDSGSGSSGSDALPDFSNYRPESYHIERNDKTTVVNPHLPPNWVP